MASDNSTSETIYSRGSYLVVHLAPEFRQEKHFYLKALCSWMHLPFYCHFSREWWPSQVRKPGHSGLALQLPGDSTCLDSSFQGVRILSSISSKPTTLPPYSLAFPLTPASHLELDFLWPCPHICTCPLNLAGSGCVHSRMQSHALLGDSGICLCLATLAPNPRLFQMPSFSFTPPNTAHLTSLHILQHSIIFYCVFLPITKVRLGGRGCSNSSLYPLCHKPAEATVQSRSKMDSEQEFLCSKTCNLGKTPGLSLVSHLSLQKHLCLANIVDHFYIAFHFCYFFKPGIISFFSFKLKFIGATIFFLISKTIDVSWTVFYFVVIFFILLHYRESVRSYGFCLFWQL